MFHYIQVYCAPSYIRNKDITRLFMSERASIYEIGFDSVSLLMLVSYASIVLDWRRFCNGWLPQASRWRQWRQLSRRRLSWLLRSSPSSPCHGTVGRRFSAHSRMKSCKWARWFCTASTPLAIRSRCARLRLVRTARSLPAWCRRTLCGCLHALLSSAAPACRKPRFGLCNTSSSGGGSCRRMLGRRGICWLAAASSDTARSFGRPRFFCRHRRRQVRDLRWAFRVDVFFRRSCQQNLQDSKWACNYTLDDMQLK